MRDCDEIATSLSLTDSSEVEAALVDLESFLFLAWSYRKSADRNASVPKQREQLIRFLRNGVRNKKSLDRLDPALANRIGCHLDGGTLRLLYGSVTLDEIRNAAEDALKRLPHAKRGRPSNTASLADRQLGLGLATVWRDHTGQLPTRRHRHGEEYGPFHAFVGLILNGPGCCFKSERVGTEKQVDHLMRLGVAEFHLAAYMWRP